MTQPDRPPVSGEPSTKAGRRLARLLDDGSGTLFAPDILAIEAEAARGAAPRAEGRNDDLDIIEAALDDADRAAPRAEGLDIMGEILDLFLPFLDYPHPPQDRQRRIDERMQKAYGLTVILRAAPRAEGLDVERLAEGYCRATHYYEQHTGKPTRQCPLWEQHVETMRDTLALLSRPSDERVPADDPRNHNAGECPECGGPCRLPRATPCLNCDNGPGRHCSQCKACPTADGFDCTCLPSDERVPGEEDR